MGISEIYYSWHNIHVSKNSVTVIKWTMKMNSCQEHNIGLTFWIFTVAEKMHLREAWIPCFLQWTVLFTHLTFPVADYVWDFCEELPSLCRVTSTFLSSDSIAYYKHKRNRWKHIILPLPVRNVNNWCWKDFKPLETCRYAIKTSRKTYTEIGIMEG